MSSSGNEQHDYDLIVIGGGPVGENVADYATMHGLHVAIIETELVGGECSYWACTPSKALLRSRQALRAARPPRRTPSAPHAGFPAPAKPSPGNSPKPQCSTAVQPSPAGGRTTDRSRGSNPPAFDLIRGHGRLHGPGQVKVGERVYSAKAVALATGSVPSIPAIPGLTDARPWGTREVTAADHVPPRLIILGGGVAGTEMAFAYSSLGSRVTLLSRGTLLDREEPFVGDYLAAALAEEGVEVRIGVGLSRVDRDADGTVTVGLDDRSSVRADEILVATGRRPATDGLGFETVGLEPDLVVDDTMLVDGTDWLYAVGDVNGRALLTHQGKYQARAAGEAIAARLTGTPLSDMPWGQHVATADHVAVPRVVFTDPEVAAVGLTEAQARAAGTRLRTVVYEIGHVAGASLHADSYTGRAQLVIDEERDVVIGATFVGQDVAELLHSATIAIVGEVPLDRLWHSVPAYPTISEVWLRLLETYRGAKQ